MRSCTVQYVASRQLRPQGRRESIPPVAHQLKKGLLLAVVLPFLLGAVGATAKFELECVAHVGVQTGQYEFSTALAAGILYGKPAAASNCTAATEGMPIAG
jgi:hypothetical protein